jgi:hypothetical protein
MTNSLALVERQICSSLTGGWQTRAQRVYCFVRPDKTRRRSRRFDIEKVCGTLWQEVKFGILNKAFAA